MLNVFGKRRKPATVPAPTLAAQLPDAHDHELEIIQAVSPFTMTSPERILALIRAVEYIARNQIPGDLVECGVWRGGSVMAMILTLQKLGCGERTIWLYDTFTGMSPPESCDVDFMGRDAQQLLETESIDDAQSIWCLSELAEVRRNLQSLNYASSQLRFVVGPVEQTLVENRPAETIALLRLDTDWYESTRMEMETLFPRVADGGVLIIDDYGHWQGCRRAVDEYIQQHKLRIHLQRIDYTGRLAIKQSGVAPTSGPVRGGTS